MSEVSIGRGTRLNGIYEVDTLIGSGGMGEVYKGRTIHTNDTVAIKILRPEFGENEAALGLFRREASALHNLLHDAIVRYYVCSVDPDLKRPYLSMEFVEGRSLAQLLREGPLTFEAVCTLAQRVASGLQAAHERNIVHRDVAPDNIIISGGDVARAKIIDFGIARWTQGGEGTIIGGGFAGKYNYVSPEQLGLFGGDVTSKSDIYSLGLVLAEALNGRPLDMGGSQAQIIEKRRKVPDLGGMNMRLRPLLEQMLQPDPSDRIATMNEVANWFSGGQRAKAQPVKSQPRIPSSRGEPLRHRRFGLAAALVGLVVCGVTGVGVYLYVQPTPDIKVTTATPPPTLSPGTATPPTPNTVPIATPPVVVTPPTIPPVAVPAPAGSSSPPAPPNRTDTITAFVDSYDGGDCFFAMPISVGETAARIEGLGASSAPFEALDAAFKKSNGIEPDIALQQIRQPQCPAVTFLNRQRSQRVSAPQFEISETKLKSGQTLTGTINGYGTNHIELVLVADDGLVYNLTRRLQTNPDGKTFNLRVQLAQATGSQPQILLAVSSQVPLAALQLSEPRNAETVFTAASNEAIQRPPVSVTARYFRLE